MQAERGASKAKCVGFLADVDQDAIRGRGAIRTCDVDAKVAFSMLIDAGWRGCEQLFCTPGVKDAFEVWMSGYGGHTPTLQDLRNSVR